MILKDQILLKFDEKNKNGRIYSKDVFTKNQKRDYVKWDEKGFYEIHYNHLDLLNNKSKKVYFIGEKYEEFCCDKILPMFGEINQPETFDISISKISHKIENFRLDNANNLLGDIHILSTPNGEILKNMHIEQIAFSMRSIGSVSEDGIVSTKKIITFDVINKKDWVYDS